MHMQIHSSPVSAEALKFYSQIYSANTYILGKEDTWLDTHTVSPTYQHVPLPIQQNIVMPLTAVNTYNIEQVATMLGNNVYPMFLAAKDAMPNQVQLTKWLVHFIYYY